MTPMEILVNMFANLSAQWNADLEKKPSITPTAQYNLMVGVLNGLNTAGQFPEDYTPDVLYSYLGPIIGYGGFPGVIAVFEAHEADWEPEWPIPYAA